jgi:Zn-dependent protease with chaperone function
MTFELRIALIGLAAFASTGLLATCLVPLAARHIVRGAAVTRARRLAALRLLPSVAALAGGTLVTLSFVFFEPRRPGEEIGIVFPVFAALGFALLVTALWRGAQVVRATRSLLRDWTARPEPIALDGISIPAVAVDADFPIVAVAGVIRPRLIIARSVLASCSQEELRAVLAHEQGHIDRRDNLRRLLITSAPDVISWLPASGRLFAAWREATEEAADDAASQAGAEGRLRLASALIKVAKLAPGPAPAVIPTSALYCGERLEGRIRRLLEPFRGDHEPSPTWRSRLTLCVGIAGSALVLEGIHTVIETAIHTLP